MHVKKRRGRIIITGLTIQLPLIVAVSFLIYVVKLFDSFYGRIISLFIGQEIPGLGLAASLLVAIILGILVETERGKRTVDFLLKKFPRAKLTMDKLIDTVKQWKKFYALAEEQGVFLASYHRKEMLYPAVVTNSFSVDSGKTFVTIVFGDIPIPKPFAVLKTELIYPKLSFAEATTYMLTGGLTLHLIKQKLKEMTLEEYVRSLPSINIDL